VTAWAIVAKGTLESLLTTIAAFAAEAPRAMATSPSAWKRF
jgi:hypothetical protein